MSIELTCPCGKRLQVADAFAGRQGQCPACGRLLPIPEHSEEAAGTNSSEQATEGAFIALRPIIDSAAEPPAGEQKDADADDHGKLTAAGCVLTLISVAVIFAVALPLVRWRDAETGEPLPRSVAIFSPFIIAAIIQAIGTFLLRLVGLPVWAKQEKVTER